MPQRTSEASLGPPRRVVALVAEPAVRLGSGAVQRRPHDDASPVAGAVTQGATWFTLPSGAVEAVGHDGWTAGPDGGVGDA